MQRVRQRIRHTAHVEGGGLTPEQSQQIGQIEGINNRLTTLSNVAAKTNIANTFSANQNIQGQLVISGVDNPIKIDRNGSTWLGIYNGNTRRCYFGYPSSNSNFELKNEMSNGNIEFSLTGNNAKIRLNGTTEISGALSAWNTITFGTNIKAGLGGRVVNITPEDSSNKTLNIERFEINMNNKKITGVATPTANNDVANKAYVDNKALKKQRIEPKQFAINVEHSLFTPTDNQSVVSINMYRKRNDNKWFLISGDNANQIFRQNPNAPFTFYPTTVNGYTNEYFFEIYYME